MISVRYKFTLKEGVEEVFNIELDDKNLMVVDAEPVKALPEWTRLEFNKCANCSLKESDYEYCPLASKLVDVVLPFERLVSFDNVLLRRFREFRVSLHSKFSGVKAYDFIFL